MSLSLLGIIAVQSYFIKSNLEKNNQEFELNINQVLTTVSNDIEKREYSEYVYKFNELINSGNITRTFSLVIDWVRVIEYYNSNKTYYR